MNTSGKFILNSIYFENQWDPHEYLMRRGNISGTREIRRKKKNNAGGSKSTRALTRDQQYILFRLKSALIGSLHDTQVPRAAAGVSLFSLKLF